MPDGLRDLSRLAALVVAALVAVACGGGGDAVDRPSVPEAPGTTSTAPAPPPGPEALEWTACGDAECATLAVPVDHDVPDGPSLDLALLRLPARGERIGSLVVNFGGPGSSAVAATPTFPWPEQVRDRFDVVAVDPRGVGRSTPVRCGVPAQELYAVDHVVDDAQERRELLDVSTAFAASCEQEHGDLLPHLGTWDVARDLDRVRAALGDEQLTYVGYSYGTLIGQAYAELFPERVRALVLDGIVDPDGDGVESATAQAVGFEVALDRWARGCDDRPTCSLDDPIAAVDAALVATADEVPAGDRTLGTGQAVIGTAMAMYDEGLWPLLDAAIAAVGRGEGDGLLALADRYAALVEFAAFFSVTCLDRAWPDDPDELLAAGDAAAGASPRFGEALVNDHLRCVLWPATAEPIGPVVAAGAPPLLLVSTTGDPATPHAGAEVVADRLASGVLLVKEGDGHTAALRGDPCVDPVVLAYLTDLVVPAAGTRC